MYIYVYIRIDGHHLRASYGTTKYCNNFIRGVSCSNPDCVYLHELGDDEDRFTKEEIQVLTLSLYLYLYLSLKSTDICSFSLFPG